MIRNLILTALLALAACKKRGGQPLTVTGIDPSVPRTCAWNRPSSQIAGGYTGTCISLGRAYACVYDFTLNHIACAPMSAVPEVEKP